MSIIGLTDRPILRRDGKIRAGKKEGNKLVNTEHFLLHDAPGLLEMFGDQATEIFFTVHSDNPTDFMKADLRLYNASQLLCMSMHNAPDDNNQNMGSVAAYFGTGTDVMGLQQRPFPRIGKSRVRVCNYKSCPDYVQGKCSEHMFLDVIVPQFSMGAVFTLDSTSINAILNAHSTFSKAWTRYGGKLSGQIFRMYKKPGEIKYQKQDGSTGKRDAPMVYIDMVNFDEYEAKFRKEIRPEDWEALMNIRNRTALTSTNMMLSGAQTDRAMLAPPDEETQAALPAPGLSEEDPVVARANDPAIVPLFEEYGRIIGREASEAVRIATMKNIASVAEGITYLKNKIKEAKKSSEGSKPASSPSPQAGKQPPTAPEAQAGGLY